MMKTTGVLMLMAFLCSGTAFAQSTTVKAEQRANVNAKTNAASLEKETRLEAGSTQQVSANGQSQAGSTQQKPVNSQLQVISTSETSTNGQLQAISTSEVRDLAEQKMNTAIETGNHITAQTVQSVTNTAHSLKTTLNTSAGTSANLLKSTNLKIRPARINTQIISSAGLLIR